MGGGLCWLDYDGDGWLDLYVVNSYAQTDVPGYDSHGGLPRSRLFHNVKGRFEDVTAATGAGLAVRGSGCVAADLDGNGTTDLVVTTSSYDAARNAYDALLWNNGDGTFTEGAKAAGIDDARLAHGRRGRRRQRRRPARPVRRRLHGRQPSHPDVGSRLPGGPRGGEGRPVPQRGGLAAPIRRSARSAARPGWSRSGSTTASARSSPTRTTTAGSTSTSRTTWIRTACTSTSRGPAARPPIPRGLGFRLVERGRAEAVDDPNAGMGIAAGDYSGDGVDDLFVTNSRGQLHAVYRSRDGEPFADARPDFAPALGHRFTGWGATWADLDLDGTLELAIANGAIPVTSLAKDAQRPACRHHRGRLRPRTRRRRRRAAKRPRPRGGRLRQRRRPRPRPRIDRRRASSSPQRRGEGQLARGRAAQAVARRGRDRCPAGRAAPRPRDAGRRQLPVLRGSRASTSGSARPTGCARSSSATPAAGRPGSPT